MEFKVTRTYEVDIPDADYKSLVRFEASQEADVQVLSPAETATYCADVGDLSGMLYAVQADAPFPLIEWVQWHDVGSRKVLMCVVYAVSPPTQGIDYDLEEADAANDHGQ